MKLKIKNPPVDNSGYGSDNMFWAKRVSLILVAHRQVFRAEYNVGSSPQAGRRKRSSVHRRK